MNKIFFFSLLLLTACGNGEAETNFAASQPACSTSFHAQATSDDSAYGMETFAADEAIKAEIPSQRFIVKMAPGASAQGFSESGIAFSMNGMAGGSSSEKIGEDTYAITLPTLTTAEDLQRQMRNGEYEYIEPDFEVHALALNDPAITKQWAHSVINSEGAWAISHGNKNVIVAVLDSGIDYNHPDLRGNMWKNPAERINGADDDGDGHVDDIHGWNFVADNNSPIADDAKSFHGTHVAGTIGAVGGNGIGIAGHAPSVQLMALKFLNKDGAGLISHAVRAIDYAIKHKAKIINNSWGSNMRSQALSDAIDRARSAGILFVAAAGNYGKNNDLVNFYPTNYPQNNIVRVAATDRYDRLASFSNYGPRRVDLAAPGVNIYSTKNGGAYHYLSGTSMATPLVSGVLATMMALRPDLSYLQIKTALMRNVDIKTSLRGKMLSNGRINPERAIKSLANKNPDGTYMPAPMDCFAG